MYGYIYKTTNLINNKIYIGKHKAKKFDPKYKGSGVILQRAIKKYGVKNFKVEIIKWFETLEDLNNGEKYYIKLYNSQNRDIGYNRSEGGDGGSYYENLTQEEKERIKEKQRQARENWTDEFRKTYYEKLSKTSKGRVQSLETRQKKSQSLMGHKVSEETRKKIADTKNTFYQTPEGEQLKKQISESLMGNIPWNKGKKMSEEYCQISRESHPVGYFHHTEDAKQRISHTLKEGYASGRLKPHEPINKVKCRNIDIGEVFDSLAAAARKYNISNPNSIRKCSEGKFKHAGGYRWEIITEEY